MQSFRHYWYRLQLTLLTRIVLASLFLSSCSNGNLNNNNQSEFETGVAPSSEQVEESNAESNMLTGVGPDSTPEVNEPDTNTGVADFTLLESGIEGGPALTTDSFNQPGIHLRQFHVWTDAEEARSDLVATSFSDGGDRSFLADVLAQEDGTLVALYPGLQSSSGVVDADIESVEVGDERMTITIKTQVVGNCNVDDALASPFRILHIAASAPSVFFRESIHRCIEEDNQEPTHIGRFVVEYIDDKTARIDWLAPLAASEQIRYEIFNPQRELATFDSTDEPSYTLSGIVPGVIHTRRIVPINADDTPLSVGTTIALMTDAPNGLFGGRVTQIDVDAIISSLVGDDVRDCGEFPAFLDGSESVTEIASCISNAFSENVAFTATRVFRAEAFGYQYLINDGGSNSWLLFQDNSDVPITNDFAPSIESGGLLDGQPCQSPEIVVEGNQTAFSC